MADEKRWVSDERHAKMSLATTRYYNRRVFARQFLVGEMALRRNEFAHQDMIGKLSPKWEGPYKVIAIEHPNTYVVKDMHGQRLKIHSTQKI